MHKKMLVTMLAADLILPVMAFAAAQGGDSMPEYTLAIRHRS